MRFSLFLLFIFICAPLTANAAFKSSSDVLTPEAATNPVPLQDDISLPMPCGLKLVMRAVHVPGENLLRDRAFAMGIAREQSDRNFYEGRFTGHIAAPFTINNLPFAWQKILKDESSSGSWYFIGKYEISQMQWDAVMKALDDSGNENPAACPVPAKGMNQPVTNVSWFEVQNFINRYNAWLVKNYPKDLPSFPGTQNTAFVRLPTEEEWEYAARGGENVPPEWWADKDFFPLAEGRSISDYGVFNAGTPLQGSNPVGSRLANPLGLHDTAGNVREMIDGFFRMSIADMRNGQVERRLHGASGGVLSKGGSFRSTEEGVLPGARDETPLYTMNGPAASTDLGFRLALASINVPDASRMHALRKDDQIDENETVPSINPDEFASPRQAVEAILKADDGKLRASLEKLRSLVDDQEEAYARENADNVERAFRGLLYQAETLRSYAFRYAAALKLRDQLKAILAGNINATDKAKAEKGLASANADLKDYLSSLEMGASYYKNGLLHLAGKTRDRLAALKKQAEKEYSGEGVFNEHMRHNAEILSDFLNNARNIKNAGIKSILEAILPEQHYKMLEKDL